MSDVNKIRNKILADKDGVYVLEARSKVELSADLRSLAARLSNGDDIINNLVAALKLEQDARNIPARVDMDGGKAYRAAQRGAKRKTAKALADAEKYMAYLNELVPEEV